MNSHSDVPVADDGATSSVISLCSGAGLRALVTPTSDLGETANLAGFFPPGFEDIEETGRGGMGVVYRARQQPLGRVVAIKMLTHLAADSTARERFRLEARTLASLRHPHLTAVHDYGEHLGNPYLVLEYVAGGSLQQRLRCGPMTPRAGAELIECVARVVEYIHSHGIIHRDLKPGNILLTEDGVPRVADFGLARIVGEGSELTNTGVCLGTPDYMPPEQTYATQALTTAVDVYALGAILYELLVGRPPFRNDKPFDTLTQVRLLDPVLPKLLNPGVPLDLQTICLKCLEKDPARRYSSAAALADDLQRWLRDEPIQARPITKFAYVRRWCRRNPTIAGLSGALILLTIGTLIGLSALVVKLRRTNADLQSAVYREEIAHGETQHARNRARQVIEDLPIAQMAQVLAQQKKYSEDQERFLNEVISYYRELCAEAPATLEERRRQCKVYARLADFLWQLNRLPEALTAARAALEFARQLAADHPDTLEDIVILAHSQAQLCRVLGASSDHKAALEQGQAEVATRRQLVERFPDRRDLKYALAQAQLNLGPLLARLRQPVAGEKALAAGLVLLEELVAAAPDNRAYRQDLAGNYHNRGLLLKQVNRLAEARQSLESSVREFEFLRKQGPSSTTLEECLAGALSTLGLVLASQQEINAAEEAHQRALHIQRELAAHFPQVVRFAVLYGGTLYNLGQIRLQTQRFNEAFDHFERATTVLEGAFRQAPTDGGGRGQLLNAWVGRGHALEALDRHSEATVAWERALRLETPPGSTLQGFYTRSLIQTDRVSDAQKQLDQLARLPNVPQGMLFDLAVHCARAAKRTPAQMDSWSDCAMALLLQIQKTGYFKDEKRADKLQDPNFAVLRERPDFQQLQARIGPRD